MLLQLVLLLHPRPLLSLLAQAVHSPDQVPQSYIDPYNETIPDAKRRTFAGMLSALDEAVGNVTAALAAAGMADNALVIFAADNGGPVACGASMCGDATGSSNYPLRGGKHSLWEGGVRLTAAARGPMIQRPPGGNITGLMHHADWLPTFLEAAGVSYIPVPGFELHGASQVRAELHEMNGLQKMAVPPPPLQWPMLTAGAPSSRNETICNIDPLQPAGGGGAENQGNAAIVSADGWKLQMGLTGPPWAWSPPNSSEPGAGARSPEPPVNCSATFSVGKCLPGNDLTNVTNPVPANAPADCCSRCASTAGCQAWTWNAGQCYVKFAAGPPKKGAKCTSSLPGSRPAPPVWPLANMTVQLFNLAEDPWERHEVSAENPAVVARLAARLAQWGVSARTPLYWDEQVDPASDPALRNGTWTPWLP